ncbi:MAG TPA: outer membrane lipoprotein-sorting protein [Treponemataceae bacterium]|nr:outer membrane lipoprotein-sorting protein [Treponemataceae bacterium]
MKKTIMLIATFGACLAAGAQDVEALLDKNENMPRPPASQAEMRMVITNKAGQSRTREISAWTQTKDGEFNKQMMTFTAPADVRDTRFLTVDWKDPAKADEQAIYIPALRKVRTIGAAGGDSKTGAFLGSDFSFADIGSLDRKYYDAKSAGKETLDGVACVKVEFTAKGNDAIANYGYSKVVKWLAADNATSRQTEFYDKNGKLIKRLVVSGTELVDGKYWQFKKMQMFNLVSGGNTVWEFITSKNLPSIADSYFTLRYLERGR